MSPIDFPMSVQLIAIGCQTAAKVLKVVYYQQQPAELNAVDYTLKGVSSSTVAAELNEVDYTKRNCNTYYTNYQKNIRK